MKEHYQGLGHVAIYTKSMDGSIAFYEKIGGALRQRASIRTPDGEKLLALVDFGGVTLELIQSPTPMPLAEGNIPHFAVLVDDIDRTAAAIRAAGVDTFLTPEKKVLGPLRRAGELVFHRPLRGADRAFENAVKKSRPQGGSFPLKRGRRQADFFAPLPASFSASTHSTMVSTMSGRV